MDDSRILRRHHSDMRDLRERLSRADKELQKMADKAQCDGRAEDAARLSAKADGVRLALSYAQEYK